MPEHPLIVRFDNGSTDLSALFELEDQLEHAIDQAGAGEYDGNEIAMDGSDGTLFMYGPDAERRQTSSEPLLPTGSTLLMPRLA